MVETPFPGSEGPRGAGLSPDSAPPMSASHPHGSAWPLPPSPLSLRALLGSYSARGPLAGSGHSRGLATDPDPGCVSGILYGPMTMELGGSVTIECQKNDFRAELEFKLKVALAAVPPATRRASGPCGPPSCAFWAQGWFPKHRHPGEQLLAPPRYIRGPEMGRGCPHATYRARTGPRWGWETQKGPCILKLRYRPGWPPGHRGSEPPCPTRMGLWQGPPPPGSPGVHGSADRPSRSRVSVSGVSPQPFFGGSTSINQISGRITSGEAVLAHLSGHWVRGRPRAPGHWGSHRPALLTLPGRLLQDREVFIQEEGRGSAELFWNPSGEVRGRRLRRRTVLLEEQAELESER